MSDFKVGDRVTVIDLGEGTVDFGPVSDINDGTGVRYLVGDDSGNHTYAHERDLNPVPTDPRRDVVVSAVAKYRGFAYPTEQFLEQAGSLADAVLAALDAHAAPAKYRDDDGGTWIENENGNLSALTRPSGAAYTGRALINLPHADVEDAYGPLTDVSDDEFARYVR